MSLSSPACRRALGTMLGAGLALITPVSVAVAIPDDGRSDEGADTARATSEAELARQAAGIDVLVAATSDTPQPAGATVVIDDFQYDELEVEGRAADVCVGRILPGTLSSYFEVRNRFGGSAGTLYSCRERWNAPEEPDCNGTVVNPDTNPDFTSTCWSNHAAGRAFDLMVGTTSSGYNVARGNQVVNWLLATDANGNYNANARRLGVQQLLWNDRCWNTDDDRGIASAGAMRTCGIGHFDHIHVDMTVRGAAGDVSYWGASRVPLVPRLDALVWTDDDNGQWLAWSWFNFVPRSERSGYFAPGRDAAITGDWDRDGRQDDLVVWSRATGMWSLVSWSDHQPTQRSSGSWSPAYDIGVAGDWDSDGTIAELFLMDTDTGEYEVQTWTAGGPTVRVTGRWAPAYRRLVAGDFDEDGNTDDMFLMAPSSGAYKLVAWTGLRAATAKIGSWSPAYTRLTVGDWDGDGELNDMFLQAPSSGAYNVVSWNKFRATVERRGTWPKPYDQIIAGDYDSEGRVDDMIVRASSSGAVRLYSWLYYGATVRRTFTSAAAYDVLAPGTWG